jgi:hypothetical protein
MGIEQEEKTTEQVKEESKKAEKRRESVENKSVDG